MGKKARVPGGMILQKLETLSAIRVSGLMPLRFSSKQLSSNFFCLTIPERQDKS
jgi:hypothetical protein